jgi:hypothetical protein
MAWNDYLTFLESMKGETFDIAITGGGEPALWSHVNNAILETKERGFRVVLYTGMPDLIDEKSIREVDELRISVYNNQTIERNYREILGKKLRVYNRKKFIPIPEVPVDSASEGGCKCHFPLVHNGWVFRCGNVGDVLARKSIDPLSARSWAEPFGNYWWMIHRSQMSGENHCLMCVGNTAIQKVSGRVKNNS